MQQVIAKPRRGISWGIAASVVLHVLLAAIFLLRLPVDVSKPEDESIKVELVSPPKPPEKTADGAKVPLPAMKPPEDQKAAAPPKPPNALPQAFEGGSTQADTLQADKQLDAPEPSTSPPKAESEPLAKAAARSDPVEKAGPAALALPKDITPPEVEVLPPATPVNDAPANEKPVETQAVAQSKRAAAAVKNEDGNSAETPERKQEPTKLTKAKTLHSKKTLSDPRVKQALGELPPNRRIVQLCSIEALEQVRGARPTAFPDMLVPYARSGGIIEDHVLRANGGAFRSKNNWYDMDFRCEVDADTTEVVSFSFAIGGAVPKSEWQSRRLKVDDGAGLARSFRSLADDLQP